MRIDVMLDDGLVKSALKASGLKSKRRVIEEGLKLLINVHCREKIRAFRGKLKWSGDLDRTRRDKT